MNTFSIVLVGLITSQIVYVKADSDESSSDSSSNEGNSSFTDLESDIISKCLGIQSYTSMVVNEFYSLPLSGHNRKYVPKINDQLDTLKEDAEELEYSIRQYMRQLDDEDSDFTNLAVNTRKSLQSAYAQLENRLTYSTSVADSSLDRYQFIEHTLSPAIMNLQTTCAILVNHIQNQKFSDD